MSSGRNFRVSVNLCMWFHDHRQKAKIFINEDIQTIGDLKYRIEKIFNINNFYLTNHDEYLPSTEDIRILQKDDTIWVMKKTFDERSTEKIVPVKISNTDNIIKSKKRSNSIKDSINEDQPLKKKKKKQHSNEENYERVNYSSPCNEMSKEKKQKKYTKHNELGMSMETEMIKSDDENVTKALSSKLTKETSKKKKKQKECDTINSEIRMSDAEMIKSNDGYVNKALSSKSTKELSKKKNKNIDNKLGISVKAETIQPKNEKVKMLSSSSSDSDTFKGDTSIQNAGSRPYINTILPVLQLHINSYNNRMNNKMETSSSTSSDSVSSTMSVQNDLQSEKNKKYAISYNSRRTLASYKKRVSVPTVTDKYLEKKKVNIVKIEYLSGGPPQKGIESSKTEGHENYNTLCDQIPKNINYGTMDPDSDKGINSINQSPTIDKNPCIETNENIEEYKEIVTNNLVNSNRSETTENKENSFIEKEVEENCNKKKSLLSTVNDEYGSNYKDIVDSFSVRDSAKEAIKIYSSKSSIISCLSENIINTKTCMQNNEKIPSIKNLCDNLAEKESADVVNEDGAVNSSIPFNGADLSAEGQIKICESTSETLKCDKMDFCADQGAKKIEDAIPEENIDHILIDDTFTNKMDDMAISEVLIGGDISCISENSIEQNLLNETSLKDDMKYSESTKQVVRSSDRLSNASNSDNGSNSVFSRRKRLSGIGQLVEDLRTKDSLVTGESMDTDVSEFITKRQRKRVRRRRKKNNKVDINSSLDDSSVPVSNYIPKPVKTSACPTIHLKFEEEDGNSLKVVDLTKKNGVEKENESLIDTSCIENITLESHVEDAQLDTFKEHILKSPSIRNLFPKTGDIIAFKILRITEDYTPDISSYIIGKVIKFDYDTRRVLYDIINGLQQCEEPEGKLALKGNDKKIDNKREFLWSEIIDPRLLFP